MPTPLRRNPHRRCRGTLEPPIEVSIRGELFDEIINNLGSEDALALHAELRRLLLLQSNHAHHCRIIRIIVYIQEIIRRHPRRHEFNYQILTPVPQFRGPLPSKGPAYATGNLISCTGFVSIDDFQEDMDLDENDY